MNKVEIQRRILITVSGLVLLSTILMIVIISIAVQDIAIPASIGLFVMIILHLFVSYRFMTAIRANKRGRPVDKGFYIVLGILLLFFGFVTMDGAFAFLDKILFVSILMFVSVFCDFVAALVTFGAMLLKTKMKN
ncbi:hypothetical protein ACFLU5_07790 [Bacteroidota bacterium]